MSRDLFLVQLLSWEDWPADLSLPSKHFCFLLAGDADSVSQEILGRLAEKALNDGCVYLCAWGPGCMRVHDSFDTRIVARDMAGETPNALHVMTTWHEGETLDEALDFLTISAWPDDVIADTCRSAIVAVVDNAGWVTSIRRRFGKLARN